MMTTATIPKAVEMVFEKDPMANYKEVRHFNLIQGEQLFSEKLNIGINRGFSKANYTYSLKIRIGNKWSKQITGLFPTSDACTFYGDTQNKKNLVLARFSRTGKRLRLFYFQNFYTRRMDDFLESFNDLY